MSRYDAEIHHRRSIRLRDYDYSQAGAYFITICAQNRQSLFGDIVDGTICLNDAGRMVQTVWDELPTHYPGVEIDALVVMPNHVHGIIVLTFDPVGAAWWVCLGTCPRAVLRRSSSEFHAVEGETRHEVVGLLSPTFVGGRRPTYGVGERLPCGCPDPGIPVSHSAIFPASVSPAILDVVENVGLSRGARTVVEVSDLAFPGRGVAKIDRLVVFVDGGLPGDTVRIEITRRHRRFIESRMVEVLHPSPARVTPRCAHFGICGGCRLQDLDYSQQLAFKARQVQNHLQRIGGLANLTEIPIIPCPSTFGYRNKMEFAFGRDRDGGLILGLHPRETYAAVFDLQECHLPSPLFSRLVRLTREHFTRSGESPYDPVRHTGRLRFLLIREGVHTGQVLVNLVTAPGEVTNSEGWVASLTAASPQVTSVVRTVNAARANVATGEVADVWHGPGTFSERLGGLEFELGPLSFFQTNTRQAETLFARAMAYAALTPDDRVLDLYSGAGAISLLAAQQAAGVTGVEVVPEAIAAARRAGERNGIANCEFICADVRQFLKTIVEPPRRSGAELSADGGGRETRPPEAYTVVIADPPRAGLHPKVVKRMIELAPPRIVYVSCNPATLARDLALFCAERYSLAEITAVDMFPHTVHIEAVALLRRTGEK